MLKFVSSKKEIEIVKGRPFTPEFHQTAEHDDYSFDIVHHKGTTFVRIVRGSETIKQIRSKATSLSAAEAMCNFFVGGLNE